jgi:acyl phosphate:glycerol-3-phosphate acyltransferase
MQLNQLQSVGGCEASLCMLTAYGLGCLTTGFYLVFFRIGQDIRKLGSGSIGAHNVGRFLGKSGFLITFTGDFGKGALAVWAVRHFSGNDFLALVALLAVTLGHIWPVQLSFHGGKGVATSLGGLLLWDWLLAMVYTVMFAALFVMFRRSTLSGLCTYAGLPLVSFGLNRNLVETMLVAALCALVLYAHRRNIGDEMQPDTTRLDPTPGSNRTNL